MGFASRFARLVYLTLVTLGVAHAAAAATLIIPTGDRNGDGRADVWRIEDGLAGTSHIAVDTNFDGRSDVHEYYAGGALVRREADRDFNNRVDLIEIFNPLTHECASTLIDADFDGAADVLLVFQGGKAVATRFAHIGSGSPSGASRRHLPVALLTESDLAPLDDPFADGLLLTTEDASPDAGDCAGFGTAGGLPSLAILPLPAQSPAVGCTADAFGAGSAGRRSWSPRGPPSFPHTSRAFLRSV